MKQSRAGWPLLGTSRTFSDVGVESDSSMHRPTLYPALRPAFNGRHVQT